MADTLAQQVESVQAAIRRLEAAEWETMLGRRQFASPELETLYARETDLLNRIARAANGGGMRVTRFVPV